MAGSKNNTSNRQGTLVVYCPECEEKMIYVKKVGGEQSGMFLNCTKCTFSVKSAKGTKQYKEYSHAWLKG